MTPAIACACGSVEWVACAPGTEAEDRTQGNLLLMAPAPDVPLQAWCALHWPWSKS
jgi:hypothetical protein